MPLLVVDNLERIYGDGAQGVPALRGVSFAADSGEFIALKGPSGCGKSTLLHLIGAMDKPTSGTVILDVIFSRPGRKMNSRLRSVGKFIRRSLPQLRAQER